MEELKAFNELNTLFQKNGYLLYFVGGSVRDYILYNKFLDIDLVTDATPDEIKNILPEADYTFSKFGFVKATFKGIKIDLTTLREEKEYIDFRHPKSIKFVKSLQDDVLRRDFTINGLYMDSNLKIYDYVNGVNDIKSKVIRMIGDPDKRISEDPLRIIRAIRFALTYKFDIDIDLMESIKRNISLLDELNTEKIKQDIRKIRNSSKSEIFQKFGEFNIGKYLD